MKKEQQNQVNGGLSDLFKINPATPTAEPAKEPAAIDQAAPAQASGVEPAPAGKNAYKAVCYNLHPDIIEQIKNIAYWDRRKANAVVTEALEQYIQTWTKNNQRKTR